MDGKAEGGDEYMAGKVRSDRVLHQSGSGEENGDGKKKCEGELEHKVEGNVGVEVNIARCRIHAKIDTWVKHHPKCMTGDVGAHCGTQGHLQKIGRSGNFKSYICGLRRESHNGETSSQWATGLERSRCGCEYTGGYGIKNGGGFGNRNSGGYEKIKRDSRFRSGNSGRD